MKALTVKQPWASLIVEGIKDIENRTWKTNFRGRILIHASAKPDKTDPRAIIPNGATVQPMDLDYSKSSMIIGSVEIVDCIINHPSNSKKTNLQLGFS